MLAQSRQGAEGAGSWLYPLILPFSLRVPGLMSEPSL